MRRAHVPNNEFYPIARPVWQAASTYGIAASDRPGSHRNIAYSGKTAGPIPARSLGSAANGVRAQALRLAD